MKLKDTCSFEEKPRQHVKRQRHHFADKGPYSQSYSFPSRHVLTWELYHKESWVPKNWCFWTVVLEKTLKSPWDCKEIKPVHPKGNRPWTFFGRTDAEAEALNTFGHLMQRADSLEKTLMLGKIEGRRRRGRQRMGWLDGIIDSVMWVRANSGRWWRTGKPVVLQSVGSQRVRYDWATEQQQSVDNSEWRNTSNTFLKTENFRNRSQIIIITLKSPPFLNDQNLDPQLNATSAKNKG